MITVALPFRTRLLFEQLAIEAENDAPAKKWWLQIQSDSLWTVDYGYEQKIWSCSVMMPHICVIV
jgi:hypothetical protein